MICLIANGRSGTNALYYNLFTLPEQYATKEPWKWIKLNYNKSFIKKKEMCEALHMFHIKPKQHTSLPPKKLIDLFIRHGVTKFIILKRMNILAILISSAILKTYNITSKVTISKERFNYYAGIWYKYEDECLEYLKTLDSVDVIEIIYETHIKNDVTIACDMVKAKFPSISSNTYRTIAPVNKTLPYHAKNNNEHDTRTLSEKLKNVDEVRKYLGEKHKWMLD
jgi:hypothetical protein